MIFSSFFYRCSSGSHRLAAAATKAFAVSIEKRSVTVERTGIPIQMDLATLS